MVSLEKLVVARPLEKVVLGLGLEVLEQEASVDKEVLADYQELEEDLT